MGLRRRNENVFLGGAEHGQFSDSGSGREGRVGKKSRVGFVTETTRVKNRKLSSVLRAKGKVVLGVVLKNKDVRGLGGGRIGHFLSERIFKKCGLRGVFRRPKMLGEYRGKKSVL